MVNARNVVLLTIAISVLSALGAVLSLFSDGRDKELGFDSFGTRAYGYRVSFELLDELDVSVSRRSLPADETLDTNTTLVLWAPLPQLVQSEPVYLQRISRWVERGGRVVVAPVWVDKSDKRRSAMSSRMLLNRNLLDDLGLSGVRITMTDEVLAEIEDEDESESISQFFTETLPEAWWNEAPPTKLIQVRSEGSLSHLTQLVTTLEVPRRELQIIDIGSSTPDGKLVFAHDGTDHVLAASYQKGQGEIVVVSDPMLMQNSHIAQVDNSVLAIQLLAVSGRGVVFDEFYHGITIRGNPLWLLTKGPYAVSTLAVLMIVGLWTWRNAVFLGPPLGAGTGSRRSVTEYVESMALFFQRGHESNKFVLQELRTGVLWSLRQQLGLRPGREDPEQIAAALARRSPARARELEDAIDYLDNTLNNDRHRSSDVLQAIRRIAGCL